MIPQDALPDLLLILFYQVAFDKGGSGTIVDSDWETVRPGTISDKILENTAKKLLDGGLIVEESESGDNFGNFEIKVRSISEAGIEKAQSIILDEDSLASRFYRFGDPALQTSSGDDTDGLKNFVAPAADRVVPLDHNSAPYQETVESVNKVIEELKKDQPLDNELGQEKHALLRAIEAGRRLLDDTRMNVEIGVKLLLEPLRLVAKKYTQVLLGALANKAVDLVSKLLGWG